MRINAKENVIELREVYTPVNLVSLTGNRLTIQMRDNGFEIQYGGKWYEAKGGTVRVIESVKGEDIPKWHISPFELYTKPSFKIKNPDPKDIEWAKKKMKGDLKARIERCIKNVLHPSCRIEWVGDSIFTEELSAPYYVNVFWALKEHIIPGVSIIGVSINGIAGTRSGMRIDFNFNN